MRDYSDIKPDMKEESLRQKMWNLMLGEDRSRRTSLSVEEISRSNEIFNRIQGENSPHDVNSCEVLGCLDCIGR